MTDIVTNARRTVQTSSRPMSPPSDLEPTIRGLLDRGLTPQLAREIAIESLLRRNWPQLDAETAVERLIDRAARRSAEDRAPPTQAEIRAAFEQVKRESTVEWVPIGLTFADRYQTA